MTPPLVPGEVLAPGYTVDRHLSRGNILDVYSVHSLERACLCVAKVVWDSQGSHADRDRLHAEARMLTQLTHPNLVRGYEVITRSPDSAPILVMEMLTGATLSRVIVDNGVLDDDDVALLGLQLGSVLHYLHSHDILHLDLKPSNIICDAGQARVLDLSLAQPPGRCRAGVGTHEYMAPEQITGDIVGPAADVWGLGGILYRSLTGRRPFPRTDTRRVPDDHPDLEPLKQANADPRLHTLVQACFEVAPIARPSIANILDVLTLVSNDDRTDAPPRELALF